MKTRKIVISMLVCFVLVFSMVIPAFAASPRISTMYCPDCITGTVYATTSRTYAHEEYFPCKHGYDGDDLYDVYEIIYRERCNSCSYKFEKETADHEYITCLAD